MAKHYRKKSHRRGYGAFLPKLSDIKGSITGQNALIGIAIGVAGFLGLKYAINKWGDKLPDALTKADGFFQTNLKIAGPILVGLIGYAAAKKFKPAMANSVLVGALGSGLALYGYDKVTAYKTADGKTPFAALADFGALGVLAPDTPFNGMGLLAQDNYGRREAELDQMAQFAAQNDLDEVLS